MFDVPHCEFQVGYTYLLSLLIMARNYLFFMSFYNFKNWLINWYLTRALLRILIFNFQALVNLYLVLIPSELKCQLKNLWIISAQWDPFDELSLIYKFLFKELKAHVRQMSLWANASLCNFWNLWVSSRYSTFRGIYRKKL